MTDVPLSPHGLWRVDTNHTQVGFSITHLGISSVHGLFTEYSGTAEIGQAIESTSVELTARTASIDTGNAWRDEHLVGENFLDCEHFPEMTFHSTALAPSGDHYLLAGDLTIKGISQPVSFDLRFCGSAVFAMDERLHAGFLATTTIRRSDFDIGYGIPVASDEVRLRIDAQIIAPDAVAG